MLETKLSTEALEACEWFSNRHTVELCEAILAAFVISHDRFEGTEGSWLLALYDQGAVGPCEAKQDSHIQHEQGLHARWFSLGLSKGVDMVSALRHKTGEAWTPLSESEIDEVVGSSLIGKTAARIRNSEPSNPSLCKRLSGHLLEDLEIILDVDMSSRAPKASLLYHDQLAFQARSLARMTEACLREIASISPGSSIGSLDLQQIWEWNASVPEAINACVHDLIELRVNAQPDAPAVDAHDGSLTYRELWDMSTGLALRLLQRNIGQGEIIPVCTEKSLFASVAVLAILRTGNGFLTLDPSLPVERMQSIIRRVDAEIMLSSSAQRERCSQVIADVVELSSKSTSPAVELAQQFRLPAVSPESVAYACFTSGSTGEPKGPMLSHRNYCSATMHQQVFPINASSRVFCFASYSFDGSVKDVLCTLIHGGCLCVPSDSERMNDLAGVINHYRANTMDIVSSVAELLTPADVPCITTLLVAGEPLTKKIIATWAPHVRLFNGYGPTECTVLATVYPVYTDTDPMVLGSGVGQVLWIVEPDNDDKLAPLGAVGELVLEGPLVGCGYKNDPERTASAFIGARKWMMEAKPAIGSRKTGRFYKTGDLVRYTEDGSVKYVGRKDKQIKLRGQRIELGEIEYHLRKVLPATIECAVEVLTSKDQPSVPLLVAFIGLDTFENSANDGCGTIDDIPSEVATTLRHAMQAVKHSLPHYMVPSALVAMKTLPKLLSRKLDRKMLRLIVSRLTQREISLARLEAGQKAAPQTKEETILQCVWAKLLNIDLHSISRDDNFVGLGGNSILAMRLTKLAREENLYFGVADVLRFPVLKELAATSKTTDSSAPWQYRPFQFGAAEVQQDLRDFIGPALNLAPEDIEDVAPATCYQVAKLSTILSASRGASNTIILDFPGSPSLDRVEAAWKATAQALPILRTVFAAVNQLSVQIMTRKFRGKLIHWRCDGSVEDGTATILDQEKNSRLDPGGELIQVTFLIKDSRVERILLRLTQTLYDGPTLSAICTTLASTYSGLPAPETTHFTEYLQFTREASGEQAAAAWRKLLAGSQVTHVYEREGPSFNNLLNGAVHRIVPTVQAAHATIGESIKAAVALTLRELSKSDDVVFGFTTWGRNAAFPKTQPVVGPCLDTMPVRLIVDAGFTSHNVVQQLRTQAIEMLPFENFGFQRVIDQCTDWPVWERLSVIAMYQNLTDERTDQFPFDEGVMHVSEVRPPSDRADLAVYTFPHPSGGTWVEVNFSTQTMAAEGLPSMALEKLCWNLERLCEREDFDISFDEGSAARIPFPLPAPTLPGEPRLPLSESCCFEKSSAKNVKRAWQLVLGCSDKMYALCQDKNISIFEIWPGMQSAVALTACLKRMGFNVNVEDVVGHPTPRALEIVLQQCRN